MLPSSYSWLAFSQSMSLEVSIHNTSPPQHLLESHLQLTSSEATALQYGRLVSSCLSTHAKNKRNMLIKTKTSVKQPTHSPQCHYIGNNHYQRESLTENETLQFNGRFGADGTPQRSTKSNRIMMLEDRAKYRLHYGDHTTFQSISLQRLHGTCTLIVHLCLERQTFAKYGAVFSLVYRFDVLLSSWTFDGSGASLIHACEIRAYGSLPVLMRKDAVSPICIRCSIVSYTVLDCVVYGAAMIGVHKNLQLNGKSNVPIGFQSRNNHMYETEAERSCAQSLSCNVQYNRDL